MASYFGFYDIVGADASRVPLVKGMLVAYYNTGSGIVPETLAQIQAARNAGMGVALIDQSPGNLLWAQGLSDILDVENGAATFTDAINGVKAREVHGWQSTIYISFSALGALEAALRAAGCNMSLVIFGVADYNWSVSEAENLLAANANWAYVQYGDPLSNPRTLIPGTNVTLLQANADIDVAKLSWAQQFVAPPVTPWPAITGLTASVQNTYATKGYMTANLSWAPIAAPGVIYQGQLFEVDSKALLLTFQTVAPSANDISVTWGKQYCYHVTAHPTAAHTATWSKTYYFTAPNA